MYCKHCGTDNPEQAKFCKSCGASLEQKKEIKEKKKQKKYIFFLLPMIIILIIVVGAISMQFFKEEKVSLTGSESKILTGKKLQGKADYGEGKNHFQKVIQNALQMSENVLVQVAVTSSKDLERNGEEMDLETNEFPSEQKEKRIVIDELEEGYYSKEDAKGNINVSLIKDYQGVMGVTVDYDWQEERGKASFEWKENKFCQITSEQDDIYEIFLAQDGTNLVFALNKDGEKFCEETVLQQQKYFNSTNVILGLKNYLEKKEFTTLSDTETYTLPTNVMESSFYKEMIEIPIQIEGKTAYYALVTTKAFEKSGYVSIYSEEDMKEIMEADSFEGKEPLEAFSIYEYYEFE